MSLENVHVFEKDRATNRANLVHINPTRIFVKGVPVEGHTPGKTLSHAPTVYVYQNGDYYGLGGNPIAENEVPAEIRANIAAVPFNDVALAGTPSVTKVCKFCSDKMNASQYDDHMEKHVIELMSTTAAKSKEAPQAPAR